MTKKLLINAGLMLALSASFVTLKSDNNGKINLATAGCTPCHGTAAKTVTVVGITGLPAGGYVPGQTYTLGFTVTHPTYTKAGYNLISSAGILAAITGTGSKISSGQLTHNAVKVAIAGICAFPFTWTAPAAGAGAVTFSGVGNAVNGDNIENVADEWNTGTWTVDEQPTAIQLEQQNQLSVSPLPCQTYCNIKGVQSATQITVTDISGKHMYAPAFLHGSTLQINTEHLQPQAIYFVHAIINGLPQTVKISK
jgi:hypothetical protein